MPYRAGRPVPVAIDNPVTVRPRAGSVRGEGDEDQHGAIIASLAHPRM
jgi:hypothetical protein